MNTFKGLVELKPGFVTTCNDVAGSTSEKNYPFIMTTKFTKVYALE